MGWTQSEAARRLGVSAAAINHLMNSDHPNKPSKTALQLLKLIVAGEKPDAFNIRTLGSKSAAFGPGVKASDLELKSNYYTPEERAILEAMRNAPPEVKKGIRLVVNGILEAYAKTISYRKGKK